MQEDLIDRLEALVIGNPDFEEVERAFGGFCPFEAMRVEKHEVRHSNFLAYYINPNRPHGFGTECLKAMMRSVAKAYRQWPSGEKGCEFASEDSCPSDSQPRPAGSPRAFGPWADLRQLSALTAGQTCGG